MKKLVIRGNGTIVIEHKSIYEHHFEATELSVSDGYHTMDELYDHRLALNAALFNFMYAVDKSIRGDYEAGFGQHLYMKSKLHHDGTMFEGGYFIVVAFVPDQISYHYKLEHWDKFKIPEVERIPVAYNGHTPNDVIKSLLKI